MIQYSDILAMLKHLGFGDKFMEWIKKCYYISLSSLMEYQEQILLAKEGSQTR
jgi:hypothetical protein